MARYLLTYNDLIDLAQDELPESGGHLLNEELRPFEELGVSTDAAERFTTHFANIGLQFAAAGVNPQDLLTSMVSVAFRVGLRAGGA